MKTVDALTIASTADGKEILLTEGEDYKTYLAFSGEWSRFVALKIYQRELYPDSQARQHVEERAQSIRSRFSRWLAFPLQTGETDGQLYQATELLPGHALQKLVEQHGPLPAPAVLDLGRKVSDALRDARETHGVRPSLAPNHIFVRGTSGPNWKVGFAEYDLRPQSQDEEPPGELQAVQELSLLLYFLGTGDLQTWFYPMLKTEISESLYPGVDSQLLALYQRLFSANLDDRPLAVADFAAMLQETGQEIEGEPELAPMAVDRPFLRWLPRQSSFPEPFAAKNRLPEVDHPCTFEASDKLRDTPSLVHILPPDSMTGGLLAEEYSESMRRAQGKNAAHLTAVETVMSDPRCRVVAERPEAAISLSALMERGAVNLDTAIVILEKIDAALKQLKAGGCETVSLNPGDIFLKPVGATSRQAVMEQNSFPWLDDPEEGYQLSLRPFRANLFYAETLNFGPLNATSGKFGQSSHALNPFRPAYGFVTLAYALLDAAWEASGLTMSRNMANVFRSAFSSRLASGKRGRLIANLRQTLSGNAVFAENPEEETEPAPVAEPEQEPIPERSRFSWSMIPASALGAAALLVAGVIAFFVSPSLQRAIATGKANFALGSDGTVNLEMEPIFHESSGEPNPEPLANQAQRAGENPGPKPQTAVAPEIIVMEALQPPENAPLIGATLGASLRSNHGRPERDFSPAIGRGSAAGPNSAEELALASLDYPAIASMPATQPPPTVEKSPPRLLVGANIRAGEALDVSSIEEFEKNRAMHEILSRAGQEQRAGNLGAASRHMVQVLENGHAAHPAAAAQLDALVGRIRSRHHRLSEGEQAQTRDLVERAARGQHFGAVSLLANWSDAAASPEAVAWNERAAEQGDANAMARLGIYHYAGKHVETNLETAMKWFERAAKLNQADALYYLGECYFSGKGVERDTSRAVALLTRAHDQGSGKASDMLGTCYAKGEGVAQDHQRARELYEESIRRGATSAFGNLGVLYLQDLGLERDEAKAFELFQRGAEANAPNAMVLLALSHERGVGTPENPELAQECYVKAAKSGHPAAIQWCEGRQIEFR